MWYERFSLIDDSPSKAPNLPGFLENRHDQSIFSLMYKVKGGTPLPSGETDVSDYSNMEKCPIWDLRDKGYKEKRIIPRLKSRFRAELLLFRLRREKIVDRVYRLFHFLQKEK